MRDFGCSGVIFLGSDLIMRHTGVAVAHTQHGALVVHTLGSIRALAIGPDSAGLHFRRPCS